MSGIGVSYSGPNDVWRPSCRSKYKVHQNALFVKRKFQFFFIEGSRKMCGRLRENVFPGPAVALNGPDFISINRLMKQ